MTPDTQQRTHQESWGRTRLYGWSGRSLLTVVLTVFTMFFVIPIIWLLIAVTKSGSELAHRGAFAPGSVTSIRGNWDDLFGFQDGAVVHWFLNSIYYSGGALLLTLVVSVPAGYALAMMTFRGRRILLITTLVVMLMPNTALVLPIFLEMNSLGLVGTPCRSSCRSPSTPSASS